MKKAFLICAVLSCCQALSAQTFNEWWRQKQTRIEYLLAQVAALQVYIGNVQEGYRIAENGLRTIGNIKDGDFNLHRDFFGALKGVGPRVRNYVKVADILAMQVRLVKVQRKRVEGIRKSGRFTEEEAAYIVRVFTRLLERSAENLEAMAEVLAADLYEMGDAERIRRIDQIHAELSDQCAFAEWFGSESDLLALNRAREAASVSVVGSMVNRP